MRLIRLTWALIAVLASGHIASGRPAAAEEKHPPGPSGWAQAQSALCAEAIARAEQRWSLPPGLLGTIAKVESGRPIDSASDIRAWPWTIDADGQGLFLESKEAAVAWAGMQLPRAQAMDVGCLQVDLQMHPGAFQSLQEAFDPRTNADYAARYLRQLWQADAGGNWFIAVGMYHSHSPWLAADYRARVAAMGAGIVLGHGAGEPLYIRAIRQGHLRLALANGGTLRINVYRQPARVHRRISPCQIASILGSYAPSRISGCGR